ncbi:hypothetical protein HZS_4622, partial [Henneguya salminicola]
MNEEYNFNGYGQERNNFTHSYNKIDDPQYYGYSTDHYEQNHGNYYTQNEPNVEKIEKTPSIPQYVDLVNTKTHFNIYDHGSYQNLRNIMESTLTLLPNSYKLYQKIRAPIGLICTPLLNDTCVHFATYNYLVRCKYCSSYLNPYVKVIDQTTYYCSICYRKNFVSKNIDLDELNLNNRPELNYPCIEYDSGLGTRGVPIPLSLVFLLDVSTAKESIFYVDAISETIKKNCHKIPGDKRASITVITFDMFIHTFQVVENGNGYDIEHHIVTDLDDPFTPFHDSCSIRFKSNNKLQYLLDKLPEIVKSKMSETPDNCLGSALEYSLRLLTKFGGGRITVFLHKPPTVGYGHYTPRVQKSMLKGDKEECSIFAPSIDYYRSFGMEALNKNVSIDLFCLNKDSVDLANLLPLCRLTGGEVFNVPSMDKYSFQANEWLKKNIELYLMRELRLLNTVKLRMNEAFEIQSYFGHFFVNSIGKLTVPVINKHSTFSFQLIMDSDPRANRLRVITLPVYLSDFYENIFDSINFPCLFSLISRMAVDQSFEYSLSDTKSAIINCLVDLIKSHHTFLTQSISRSPTVVPPKIYQLSILLHSLYKYDAFNVFKNIRTDRRVQKVAALNTWTIDFVMTVLYPTLYKLTDLLPYIAFDDSYFISNYKCFSIPSSYENIYPGGIYIQDSGFDIHIYVNAQTPDQMIKSLFNIDTYDFMPDAMVSLPLISDEINIFVHKFIELIISNRPYRPNIIIFKDTCAIIKQKFCALLVLDKTDKTGSYIEWIKKLHSEKSLDIL